jgi:hypothetical protein
VDSSNFIPKLSPSFSRRSAISWRDFLPKFLTCRICVSVWRTRSPSERMLEFLSELTERTESERSSIGVRRSSARASALGEPRRPARRRRPRRTEPKLAKYWKCVCARAAAYATASSGDGAVGLDAERQAVVVGALADTRLGDREVHAA